MAASAGPTERTGKRRIGSLLAIFAVALCVLGSGASAAVAAPSATIDSISDVTETSAHIVGTFETSEETNWRIDYSTDGVTWTENVASGGPVSAGETVSADPTGLAPNTRYFVRLVIYVAPTDELLISDTPRFTTLATPGIDPPTVVSLADASSVSIVTAKASGEVERPAGAGSALDTRCNFEYVTDAQFTTDLFEQATAVSCQPENPITVGGSTPVTANLTGLEADTTYHLRLIAENDGGTDVEVASSTFTTDPATAPVLTLDPATAKYTVAKISGTIDPEGGNVDTGAATLPITWKLEINREGAGWEAPGEGIIEGAEAESDPAPGAGIVVEKDLEGLQPGSEYKFRLKAIYAGNLEVLSGEGSFETEGPLTAPIVSIDNVSTYTATTAHFSGHVTAGADDPAFDAECEFEYTTVARDERQRLSIQAVGGTYKLVFEGQETQAIAFDAGAGTVEAELAALPAIGAGNIAVSGAIGIHPFVITFGGDLAAKDISEVSALTGVPIFTGIRPTLAGTATVATSLQGGDGTFAGAVHVPCSPDSIVKGAGDTAVEADVSGLEPHTTYHLRLRAANQGGQEIATAPDFTTEAGLPEILNTAVSNVAGTSARLEAEINPRGDATTYHFEYLTLQAFNEAGQSFAGATPTTESGLAAAGNEGLLASAEIVNLEEDSVYRYRVVAQNSKSAPGVVVGPARSFRTATVPVVQSCPNAAIRAAQGSSYLPECRAYEIVNRPGLDVGEVVGTPRSGADGEHVVYTSVTSGDIALGAGVASVTVAHRTPGGWTSTSADPVSSTYSESTNFTDVMAFTPDFSQALLSTVLNLADTEPENKKPKLFRVDVGSGASTLMTKDSVPLGELIGVTPTLDQIAYSTRDNGGKGKLVVSVSGPGGTEEVSILPGDLVGKTQTLGTAGTAWSRGLGDGRPTTAPLLRDGGRHAMSDDGKRVYFSRFPEEGLAGQIFLRDLSSIPPKTFSVSVSERSDEIGDGLDERMAAAEGARFISASHDGSQAYFVSNAAVVDGAAGGGIYRFDLDAPEGHRLTELTPAAEVSVAVPSDDQSHIYFISTSDLGGAAIAGARNAYVWTAADGIRFIATINEGSKEIGARNNDPQTFQRVTADGRYALLRNSASIDGAPTNGREALYEYDSEAGQLTCVSCRPDGSPSLGDVQLSGQALETPAEVVSNEALASDGRVLFNSTDQIVAQDQNSAFDVYLYHDGIVSLISSGRSNTASYAGDISPDGKTVTFITREAMVGADRDVSEYDLYAARVDGGFPEPFPPPAPCEGEGCRGAASSTPPPTGSSTARFVGPGNPRKCSKGKVRRNGRCVKKKHRGQHKKGKKHTQARHAGATGRTGR
jgi:hypothetical protein